MKLGVKMRIAIADEEIREPGVTFVSVASGTPMRTTGRVAGTRNAGSVSRGMFGACGMPCVMGKYQLFGGSKSVSWAEASSSCQSYTTGKSGLARGEIQPGNGLQGRYSEREQLVD